MSVKPDIKKPWKMSYENNNIDFDYNGNELNIYGRSKYNERKCIGKFTRLNTIKPVFINSTDFILFNDYKNPQYFKYNSAIYDYDITTLKLADNTYNEYVDVMDIQEAYCVRYRNHEWYNSVQISTDEDRVGQVDLIVTFEIDEDNLSEQVDDGSEYVMRCLTSQITFGIENLDKGELIYHCTDSFD
jgi:hypothetical protein